MKVRSVADQGRLIRQNGEFFEEEYRTIVTKNKKLQKTGSGEVEVLDSRGDNFFMVTPDVLVPSEAGFNYKLSAEPTFPLSKPLQQQKINELFQHPVIGSAIEKGHYDVTKIADQMLEINDFEPQDYLAGRKEETPEGIPEIDPAKMVQMAHQENELMLRGEELPWQGTPYASAEHTMIHNEFMKSDNFKSKASPDVLQRFVNHVVFENGAQQMRAEGMRMSGQGAKQGIGGGGGQPGIRELETAGIEGGEAKATTPALQQGPEGVPDLAGFGASR
jgi:hypothetical protein